MMDDASSARAQRPGRMGDIRKILRSETHDAHEKLHGWAVADALSGPGRTVDIYRTYLRALYGPRLCLDLLIDQLGDDFGGHQHLVIAADLMDLGLDDRDLAAGAAAVERLSMTKTAQIIGAAYVTFGSALGNRQFAAQIGADPKCGDWPRRFIGDTSGDQARAWATVLTRVEACATSDAEIDDMVIGARQTFDWLARCLL